MKKISLLIFKILRFTDKIFNFLTKRSFLIWFSDFVNDEFYISINICNKENHGHLNGSTTLTSAQRLIKLDAILPRSPHLLSNSPGHPQFLILLPEALFTPFG